jgi:hypothetical protein
MRISRSIIAVMLISAFSLSALAGLTRVVVVAVEFAELSIDTSAMTVEQRKEIKLKNQKAQSDAIATAVKKIEVQCLDKYNPDSRDMDIIEVRTFPTESDGIAMIRMSAVCIPDRWRTFPSHR